VAAELGTVAFASHRPLLGRIDAAVIAAPTVLHHRLAVELLEAGCHLLVEKPICTTVQEADELVEIAADKQRILQVGHVERFNPALAAAAPHVAGPKYIEAVRASGFTFRSTDVGVVLDLMIHDIDIVLSLARSPLRSVQALGAPIVGRHEDVAQARLEFENGCVANLSASRVSYEPARRMQVWGPRTFAAIDFASRTTTLVRPSETLLGGQFRLDHLAPEEIEHHKAHFAEEHLPREQTAHDAVDALALELEDFVDSILAARQPRVSGAAGRDALAVAERILEGIATYARNCGDAVAVDPGVLPYPRIVPPPHFDAAAAGRHPAERRAG
jgi:predicted dehydrogenase